MSSSKILNDSLTRVIAQHFPANQIAINVSPLSGLSGDSFSFELAGEKYIARQQPVSSIPGVSPKRHYRALQRQTSGLGPEPVCLDSGWLIVRWLAGEVNATLPSPQILSQLLWRLHNQPCFGWRINLRPALQFYWQNAQPARRTLHWLQMLKHLTQAGEPRPLRLAPLHMDIHPGNLVHQTSFTHNTQIKNNNIKIIDWEYAGDGDIALELAAVIVANSVKPNQLIKYYAQQAQIGTQQLNDQVNRWQPWVRLLMASWYEYRWQQNKEACFLTLADEAWRALSVSH